MAKCVDCGYLAVRIRRSYNLGEAGSDFRDKGNVPLVSDEKGMNQNALHELRPTCFVQRWNLGNEIHVEFGTGKEEKGCVTHVIQRGRDCSGVFTEWQLGFTPKEHREMIDRKELREREERQRRNDRIWHGIELLAFIITGAIVAIIAALVERGTLLTP